MLFGGRVSGKVRAGFPSFAGDVRCFPKGSNFPSSLPSERLRPFKISPLLAPHAAQSRLIVFRNNQRKRRQKFSVDFGRSSLLGLQRDSRLAQSGF